MIYHDIPQKSVEWFTARLGLATASCFDKIITPAKCELSKSSSAYANQLIGEMITRENTEKFENYWMERGIETEDEAAASYQAIVDCELDRGGFLTNDAMTIGASPDRRIVSGGKVVGGVEIKCPSPGVHIANLKRGAIDPCYIPQVQGQMLIGGFEFVDWFSYHPAMLPVLIRIHRDDEYCAKLEGALAAFIEQIEDTISQLKSIGQTIPQRPLHDMYNKLNREQPDYIAA